MRMVTEAAELFYFVYAGRRYGLPSVERYRQRSWFSGCVTISPPRTDGRDFRGGSLLDEVSIRG